jgi:tRNA1Val (adenine37-N6)-methyltransferase
MKVGIDGVLLGAWANVENAERILDIGTGSGLIALMLAQRAGSAQIDAIDIEDSAVRQAEINIEKSLWKERIKVGHISLQNFVSTASNKYDLIVSNPPFFIDSLKTPEKERTNARHTDMLTHEELMLLSKSLLASCGKICIILPVKEGNLCKIFAEKLGLFCSKMISVFPKPNAEAKRLLLEFTTEKTEIEIGKIIIETEIRHQYSTEFINLAKDFYLKM